MVVLGLSDDLGLGTIWGPLSLEPRTTTDFEFQDPKRAFVTVTTQHFALQASLASLKALPSPPDCVVGKPEEDIKTLVDSPLRLVGATQNITQKLVWLCVALSRSKRRRRSAAVNLESYARVVLRSVWIRARHRITSKLPTRCPIPVLMPSVFSPDGGRSRQILPRTSAMSSPPALTDAQDKAFKLEAMYLDGRAPGPTLQAWIESYVVPPPRNPRVIKHTTNAAAQSSPRRRRVDALMVMRARALESARRRWPQPRCLSKDHEKENRTRQMEEKATREAAKAKKAAREAEAERAAAAARVATLMQMRATWEGSRREISGISPDYLRPCRFSGVARVLPQLTNLRKFVTAHHVPLEEEVVPNITFRLHSFTSFSAVIGPWITFIAMQTELQELILHSDFLAPAPAPACLPCCADLRLGPPFPTRAIVRLAASPARLTSLRANGPQLKMLLHMAPALLHGLRHLVLDEDRLLCGFNQNSGVLNVAAALGHRTPFTELKDGMLPRPVLSPFWNEGPAGVRQHG
ncbi:hypothetical protein B0H13DRAFT_1865756, partial [Mycena leptocephala]